MATTNTTLLPELLEPFVTEIFFNRLQMLPEMYPEVFNIESSGRALEDTFAVAGLGTFVEKNEGTPISYDTPVQSGRKRVVHTTYALGFRVTMEMMEDDQHRIIARMPADLGDSARDHRENLAWELFYDAFDGNIHTGIPEGDGTARSLVATDHVELKTGATASNQVDPGVALSVSGLESAVTIFRLTRNDSGRQVQLRPSKLVLHPNEEFNAAQLLDSQFEPGTSDNQINAVSSNRIGVRPVMVPYLTDTDAWFLVADKSQHTLKWYNRKGMTFERNKDAQTKDALFDSHYRASVTFDDWRGVVGSQP